MALRASQATGKVVLVGGDVMTQGADSGTTEPARTLVLLRHAKSAWPEDVPDHDRPLAGRGRRDAPAAGRWLCAAGIVPDRVLCSTAQRTRQTWRLAESGLAVAGAAGAGLAETGAAGAGLTETGAARARLTETGAAGAGLTETGAARAGLTETGAAEAGLPVVRSAKTRRSDALAVSFERRVYGASAGELLDLIREETATVRTLLVIGHEPGMSGLALALAGTGAPDVLERVRAKFPTAAIAVLVFSGGWSGLEVGQARLATFVTPRDIRAGSSDDRPR